MGIRNAAAFAKVGDAEGIRRDIHQHTIDFAAGQARCQHACAEYDAKVRMNTLTRLSRHHLAEQIKYEGRARRSDD
jgi:hypothetical protein